MSHHRISVNEGSQVPTFDFTTQMACHDGGFPGGVAHGLRGRFGECPGREKGGR